VGDLRQVPGHAGVSQITTLLTIAGIREALDRADAMARELQHVQGIPLVEKVRLQGVARALEPHRYTLARMERQARQPGWFVSSGGSDRGDEALSRCETAHSESVIGS